MSRAYDDFTRTVCDTTIVSCTDGWYRFADTVFYGEKGGMPSDEGSINGLKVTGLKWDGEVLLHKVEGELKDPIHMEVNAELRWYNTAVQSAFHLLDGFFRRRGIEVGTIGTSFEDPWYEVDCKALPEGLLDELQDYMDKAILAAVPCTLSYIPGKDYPDEHYQHFDEVRVVRFGDYDCQPCGTLHLHNTLQIGSFAVLESEKSSRGQRLHCAVSFGTHAAARRDHAALKAACKAANSTPAELADKVGAMAEQVKKMKKELDEANKALMAYRAEELLASGEQVIAAPVKDAGALRALSQAMGKSEKDLILYAVIDGSMNFAILSPGGKAREMMETLKTQFEIAGGGSPKIVSGKLSCNEAAFVSALKALL